MSATVSHGHGRDHSDKAELRPIPRGAAEPTLVEGPAQKPLEVKPVVSASEWREEGETRGTRVALFSPDGMRCLAAAVVTKAEESRFRAHADLDAANLLRAACISDVTVDPSRPDLLPALLYLALRRARIWDRTAVVGYVNDLAAPGAALLGLEKLPHLPRMDAHHAAAQRLDVAIQRAYDAASPEMKVFIRRHFIPEATETLESWVGEFFQGPWFKAVYDGTLTKQQYIYALSNMHQFVRFTTRLIGRAVSLSEDRLLRGHWLHHLDEEVDHERIIEKDLAGLGADVDYVVKAMVPNVANQEFMVAQEAAIAFDQDPVVFMGAPFAAEGWSARLDKKFMEGLLASATRWGVSNPAAVTNFLKSHINYDGGDDGHWARTAAILEHYLDDHTRFLRFLNLVRLAMNSFSRSYVCYAEDVGIFGARPASR